MRDSEKTQSEHDTLVWVQDLPARPQSLRATALASAPPAPSTHPAPRSLTPSDPPFPRYFPSYHNAHPPVHSSRAREPPRALKEDSGPKGAQGVTTDILCALLRCLFVRRVSTLRVRAGTGRTSWPKMFTDICWRGRGGSESCTIRPRDFGVGELDSSSLSSSRALVHSSPTPASQHTLEWPPLPPVNAGSRSNPTRTRTVRPPAVSPVELLLTRRNRRLEQQPRTGYLQVLVPGLLRLGRRAPRVGEAARPRGPALVPYHRGVRLSLGLWKKGGSDEECRYEKYRKAQDAEIEEEGVEGVEDVIYFKQTSESRAGAAGGNGADSLTAVANACGTFALLHTLANCGLPLGEWRPPSLHHLVLTSFRSRWTSD